MLFRRQNNPATTINTQAAPTATNPAKAAIAQNPAQRPLTARPGEPTNVRPATTATVPTAPISAAQQRRVIATPAGSFSMPSGASAPQSGNRKLQVGRDITLQGEIGACDHLVIEGTVKATIKHLQQFDILDHGQFSGSLTADNADINGAFEGEITVSGRLWLRANAVVSGTIYYGSLQVEKGARLDGQVSMIDNKTATKQATFSTNEALTAANDTYSETEDSPTLTV